MQNKNSTTFLLILIATLTAFPPFTTDLYLPSLPALKEYFNTSPSLVQMSLTMSMLGLGIGQLFIGPLSDKFGRKKPLLISLIAFFISTVLCILAPNILAFNILRLVQGISASGGVVLARSIATDRCRGKILTKFLTIATTINGVAPISAPVIGGIILTFVDWRGAFIILLIYGLYLIFAGSKLNESLPENRRSKKPFWSNFSTYGKVLSNTEFLAFFAVSTFTFMPFFAYISASSFILQDKVNGYGLSPILYGLCFGINAFMAAVGSITSSKFKDERSNILIGGIIAFVGAICVAIALHFHVNIVLLELSLMLMIFAFGLLQPVTNAVALSCERKNAGTASATIGAATFLIGGIVTPIVGMGDMFKNLGILCVLGMGLVLIFSIYAAHKLKTMNR